MAKFWWNYKKIVSLLSLAFLKEIHIDSQIADIAVDCYKLYVAVRNDVVAFELQGIFVEGMVTVDSGKKVVTAEKNIKLIAVSRKKLIVAKEGGEVNVYGKNSYLKEVIFAQHKGDVTNLQVVNKPEHLFDITQMNFKEKTLFAGLKKDNLVPEKNVLINNKKKGDKVEKIIERIGREVKRSHESVLAEMKERIEASKVLNL